MTDIHDPKHPVILFIPEAGMYPFVRGLAVLGEAVKRQGGRVLITHDTGQMLRSPMMARKRMPAHISQTQQDVINKATEKNIGIIKKKYDFEIIKLADFADEKIIQEINDLIENSQGNLQDITFRNFPVGKMAQYDFCLEAKTVYSPNLSEANRKLYEVYVRNTALSIAITDKMCEKYSPSLFLTFNEYAECQAVRYSAEKNNVRRMAMTYPSHLNADSSRFSIWESTLEYWTFNHCQKWDGVKDTPIPSQYIEESWKDSIFHMYTHGSHIFSSKKEGDPASIFEKLKLDPKRKTIVAYTASPDERNSLETAMKIWGEDMHITDAFRSHTEWLSMLREYANKRDDIQIVVRVHPREGHRQSSFDSEHLLHLKKTFTENTKNFIIVWPDDPISSYDLLELADVCLISWTSMGQEANRLGIPVLGYTSNMFYQDSDVIQIAITPEEYRKRLDSIINAEYTWQQLVKAVRFYHWRTFIPALDLGETVPVEFKDESVWPKAPESMIGVINDILSGKEDLIEYNIKKWQETLNENSEKEEQEATRAGVRRLLDKIFYPPVVKPEKKDLLSRLLRKIARKFKLNLNKKEEGFVDYNLEYSEDISNIETLKQKTLENKNLRIILANGLYAIFLHNGKVLRRMSPMIVRLAKLHQTQFL